MRQAFNYAVNKEAIVREITKRGALTATGAFPGMPGYDPDFQGYYYHPEKAKRFLAEAGYPDGSVSQWCSSGRSTRRKPRRQSWPPIKSIWPSWG